LPAHDLAKPVISVGNITAGGTGKTPMVRWVAEQMIAAGHRPAVLMRGYKSSGGISDEREILAKDLPGVPIVANPDRVAGAATALKEDPKTTLFILDDGMQHRRVRRDVNLVLIHAGEPFGFGHLLPRGLLREALAGLGRADAFVLTHCGEVDEAQIEGIAQTIRRHNAAAPIFRSDHVIPSLRAMDGSMTILEAVRGKRIFAFCGIGSPRSFLANLKKAGIEVVNARVFEDHYVYGAEDWRLIQEMARDEKAEILITTEKDWVKIAGVIGAGPAKLPIFRAELSLQFQEDHGKQLLDLIQQKIGRPGLH
jgi:tetraacyldisaccharide 4'-kinase